MKVCTQALLQALFSETLSTLLPIRNQKGRKLERPNIYKKEQMRTKIQTEQPKGKSVSSRKKFR